MTVRKWGAETLVNTTTAGDQSGSRTVALAGGGYVVSWTDDNSAAGDGSGTAVKFQLYDASGGRIGGEVIANSNATGDQFNRSLTVTNDGGFVAVWTDGDDIEYRRFDANGIAIDASDRVLAFANTQSSPAVAPLGTGFAIAFGDNTSGTEDIGIQRFLFNSDPTGTVVVGSATVNTEVGPAITELAGGGFAVAWEDDTTERIRIHAFDVLGVETIAAIDVSGPADTAVGNASIAGLANGSFVVAWSNTNAISPDASASVRGRIVFSGGLGTEFIINTDTTAGQSTPHLAALTNGGFVAVYRSAAYVRGQLFDASGAKVGDEFVVNTSTDGPQSVESVTALADGRFVVTWTDTSASQPDDSSGHAIRQQIFDPRDGVVTGTESAETLLGHDLLNDEINGLGGPDTLNGLGGSDNLYGGDGGDTYIVGAGDQVFETSGGGNDTVLAAVSFALGANVENLTLTGAGKINATGNALANVLIGNGGANILAGGLGTDTMSGNGGADRFDFNAVAESGVGPVLRDVITGFSHAQHDRIDLATIDANQTAGHAGNQAFVFIGTQSFAAHAGSGEVRRGPGGIIQVNVDADNAPEMEISVAGALVVADFIL